MKSFSLGLLLTLSLVSNLYAKDLKYPAVIAERVGDGMAAFSQCAGEDSCEIIGKPYGYVVEELQFSPNFRKVRAIGTGAVEGVAAGGFIIFAWLTAGLGPLGVKVTIVGLGLGGVVISGSLIDAIDPILQYKMANVEKTIQSDLFDDNDFIAIEFDNEKEMTDFVKTLKKVLQNVSNY